MKWTPETLKRNGLKLETLEEQIATELFHVRRARRTGVIPQLGQMALKRLRKEHATLKKRIDNQLAA